MSTVEEFNKKIWFERYRPSKLDDMILPESIRNELLGFIKTKDIPNLMLYSPGGMGKTSAARILIKELNMDFIEINGSLDTSVEMVRDKITKFASTASLYNSDQNKCLFVTEADGFSTEAKNSLKNLIEKFNGNIRIIFDTNYIEKLPQPLRSRCVEIDFNYSKKDYPELMKQTLKRCIFILDDNKIKYDKKDVADLIKQGFPDIRKIVNELQQYSISGEFIKSTDSPESQFESLMEALKSRKYDDIRNIVKDIVDIDHVILRLYNNIDKYIDRKSLPQIILIIADYQHKSMLCISKEINLLAMFTEILSKNIEFK